jgi:hypothetical protein
MRKSVQWAGYLGLLGAVLVGAGEFILQYSPGADYAHGYDYFAEVSKPRLSMGHFLSVLAAPLYVVGYWYLSQRLDPKNTWVGRSFFVIGAYAFIVGAAWMGQRVFLALTVQEMSAGADLQNLLNVFSAHNEPFVNVLRVAMAVLALIWIYHILKGRSSYPKWMAIFSPAAVLATIILLYVFVPGLGGLLVPNAMNVAHIVVFALSLWVARPQSVD